jgi:putative ABC transport system permease protein
MVKTALSHRVPSVDVHTNREFRDKTVHYWVLSTGAGITTLIGAVLGLIVGIVVVTQTIYAATVDHLREFGTLKAMGATNGYIYRVIVQQAVFSAAMGYSVAIVIAWFVARSSETSDALVLFPWQVAVGTFGLALFMCASASIVSIRKATTIDPAMVFKG